MVVVVDIQGVPRLTRLQRRSLAADPDDVVVALRRSSPVPVHER